MTGLEIIKTPSATAGQIADIIAEHCPPVVPEHCDKLSCRKCWLAWLATGEPPEETGPSDKQTAPDEEGLHPNLVEMYAKAYRRTQLMLRNCDKFPELLREIEDHCSSEASPPPPRDRFRHLSGEDVGKALEIYRLGMMLEQEYPDNDCRIYLNTFRAARELDVALDGLSGYAAEILWRELRRQACDLQRMYQGNYAIGKYRKKYQCGSNPRMTQRKSEEFLRGGEQR